MLQGDARLGRRRPFSTAPTWQADVQTTDKSTTEVSQIPLKDFVPSMRGQPVRGHVLRPAEMLEVGLMLSLYKAGGAEESRVDVRQRHLPIRGEARGGRGRITP